MLDLAYPFLNQKAPSIALPDDTGKVVQLEDLMGDSGLMLVFIYGTYCPTCLETYMRVGQDKKRLTQTGLPLVFISLDKWQLSHTFKLTATPPLDFPILSDEDGQVHEQYDLSRYKFGLVAIDSMGIVRGCVRQNHYPGTKNIVDALSACLSHGIQRGD